MEGAESPRITDEVVENPQNTEVPEGVEAAPEILINGAEQPIEEVKVDPQEIPVNPDN